MGIAGSVSAMSTRPPTRRWPALWTALALGLGIIADDTLVAGPAVWAGIAGGAWLTAAPPPDIGTIAAGGVRR